MEYRIGLDIGIGSVGWAVVSGSFGKGRIENFGTRIFDSGENTKDRISLCQDRRQFRSVRRLERRKIHRRELLKRHFDYIRLTNSDFYDDFALCRDKDVYKLKVDGLTQKLTPAEIYKCLVHTCNHRGYREFYEPDESDKKVDGKLLSGIAEFEKEYTESQCRTVSEFLLKYYSNGGFVNYRNRKGNDTYNVIRRSIMVDEIKQILEFQKKFYPVLTEENITKTLSIVFAQRDFETGPGNENDETRMYKGFLALRGNCPFYRDELRGFRATVIADLYGVVNTLSQYRYVDRKTGEYNLPSDVAVEIINSVLQSGKFTLTGVKAVLKIHNIEMLKSEGLNDSRAEKAVYYIAPMKQCIENAGENWEEWINEEQLDEESPSKLHIIGEILSKFQTPSRRKAELKKLDFVSDNLARLVCKKNLTGSAKTSYRYMCEAVKAFMNGDIYGNFQADFIKHHIEENKATVKFDKLPPNVIDDDEVKTNRVVFKAINETRKIINAIIEIYGTPDDIIVEVADELGRSFDERSEIAINQKKREAENDNIKKEIIKIMGYDSSTSLDEIKPDMIDRYKLYIQQEGKCLYSGEPLGDIREVLSNAAKLFEVDHIVPYSLVLDNTLNNKALVFARENQLKKQRTPLMYLEGERKDNYLALIHHIYSRDNEKKGGKKAEANPFPMNAKKLSYLELNSIYSDEARAITEAWKSRNINDTRYITKYIVGILSKNLRFKEEGKHVFGIKGAVTSRMRRTWLAESEWGKEDKDRETYLNHALDATVIACLTQANIEIASDGIKLFRIYTKHRKSTESSEYSEYLECCKRKMKKYYGFDESYTEYLLKNTKRVPCFIEKFREEVDIRFNDTDEERFENEVKEFYKNTDSFVVKPHIAITSRKQNLKFKGCIADRNPIRVVQIDGVYKKISKKAIADIKASDISKIYTEDKVLIDTLIRIFDGKKESYTVADYLKENGLTAFKTDIGQPIRKISMISETVSNFAKKRISDDNYSILGGLKYYCFELYKNFKGDTCLHGVRYIDIVKKNGKLYIKAETIPDDYAEHTMYLFKDDYVEVFNGKGDLKFAGYSGSAYNINQNRLYKALINNDYEKKLPLNISSKDKIHKYNISILGEKGGEVKCSEPLSLIRENT